MPILRPYQQQLTDDIRASWDAGNRNVCAVLPTGGGKTVTFSAMNDDNVTSCTIVHRQELVGQISKTYAQTGIRHNIIAPQPVINFCIAQMIKEVGRSFYDPKAPAHVAGVDTLIRRYSPGDRWSNSVRRWTGDECFIAGTMIDGRKIESVRVGDLVTAFDDQTGTTSQRRVVRTFKNQSPENLLKVVSPHHVLYVTKGHPLWTQRGWVFAGDLTNDDSLLTDAMHMVRNYDHGNRGIAAVSLAKNRTDFLQSVVRSFLQGCEQKTASKNNQTVNELPHLWDNCSEPTIPIFDDGSRVLFQDVQQSVSCGSIIRDSYGNEQAAICDQFGTNEKEQSDAQPGDPQKGFRDVAENWPHAENTWRERITAHLSGESIECDVRADGVRDATCCQNTNDSHQRCVPLQDRLRTPVFEDRNRSGRVQSHSDRTSAIGRKEGPFLAWSRVESISVLKRNDPAIPGDGYVYNIEVDGLHTYIANGVVVHNCHHFRQENKWSKAVDLFPNAQGLGVTATPIRADNKSLHADQGGVFHDLVQGVGMRDLIGQGYLCDYRVIAPEPSINEALLKIGSTGEFTDKSKKEATRAEIIGDVVQTYLQHVSGKQAIVFARDVEQAKEIADQFRTAGVRAAALDGTTNDSERQKTVDQFAVGSLQVLVNVDLFGEGFDVPACEVVIMARPTMSFGLFVQQFGRCLRPASGKQFGIIIDHVGNVLRMAANHGMPDTPRRWQLWKDEGVRGLQRNPDAIPMRTCLCGLAYPALDTVCPYCGLTWVPESRDVPKHVDGILSEMSPELLAQLRAAKAQVWTDTPAIPYGATDAIRAGIHGRHVRTQMAHLALAEAMEFWGGVRRVEGDTDTQMQARFLHRFGIDVMTAQTLPASKALELRDAIRETLS